MIFNMKKIKITFNAPLVLGFVFICFIATFLGYITCGKTTVLLFSTYHSSLSSPFTWIRFILHVFGHANFKHFINNMMYILMLGPLLEEKYGSGALVKVIIVTAVVTGIVNYIFFTDFALCGASGVVFAFIIMASFTSFKDGEWPLTFILVIIVFLGQQVYEGIVVSDNVSQLTHILGGIVGSILVYDFNKY